MDHFLKVLIEFFYNIASAVYVLFFFGGVEGQEGNEACGKTEGRRRGGIRR